MSPAVLRRVLIWGGCAVLAALLILSFARVLQTSIVNSGLVAQVRPTVLALRDRRETMERASASARQALLAIAIPAPDSAGAQAMMRERMALAFPDGETLRLTVSEPMPGELAVQFHWRGSEEGLRAGLEALTVQLPHCDVRQMSMRTVMQGNAPRIELEAEFVQVWAVSP